MAEAAFAAGAAVEPIGLDDPTLVGPDPDRPLPLGDLDIEAELASVEHLTKDGPDSAGRPLAGGRYVLKVANPAEDPEVLDMENAAMAHIGEVAPDVPVPALIPAASRPISTTERA